MAPVNRHGSVFVIEGAGILVEGPSGAGKSSLVLAAIERARLLGKRADLVADDQVMLQPSPGGLLATPPPALAGLIEIWPLGPRPMAHVPLAIIRLLVELVPESALSRIEDLREVTRAGVALPCIRLPARNIAASLPALLSLLEGPDLKQA